MSKVYIYNYSLSQERTKPHGSIVFLLYFIFKNIFLNKIIVFLFFVNKHYFDKYLYITTFDVQF